MKEELSTLLFLILILSCFLISSDSAQIGASCAKDEDCGSGLKCDSCGGATAKCTQIQPFDPKSKDKGLPFNKYSWLTTHNSFAMTGQKSATGTQLIAPTNQLDTISDQLKNGVRGLMLDMYDFQNDIWLCHSFGGNCYNFTAFQPASNVLKEIQTFLENNTSEVVTIFIEDYVKTPNGLNKLFNSSGLTKYWFPVAQMPKNGGDWPLLSDMISKNQRLLVFTSKKAKQANEGLLMNGTMSSKISANAKFGPCDVPPPQASPVGPPPSNANGPPVDMKPSKPVNSLALRVEHDKWRHMVVMAFTAMVFF